MLGLDVFKGDAFSMAELTAAINIVPNKYGRLQELNLFPGVPISTTTAQIEMLNGVLNLLPSRERGVPAPTVATAEKRSLKSFIVPHIPHDDRLLAADIQNIRAFGKTGEMEQLQTVLARKLMSMRSKHDITLEYLRVGAMKGLVVDADGSTLLDLFTDFGVTQKVVDFVLGTDATDVDAKLMEVVRHIEDNLMGDTMSYVHALVSSVFFDKFCNHPKVRDAFKYYQSVQEPLRKDVRRQFWHKGVLIEEYRGRAPYKNADGSHTVRDFIPSGDARFFPVGTQQTFNTSFAPADFFETVNTPGLEIYVKVAPDSDFNRYVEVHTQSNPLPLCMRPGVLVRGHSSN